MSVKSKSLDEIHKIRNRWATMPDKEMKAEQERLFASAMRRIARLKKQKV